MTLVAHGRGSEEEGTRACPGGVITVRWKSIEEWLNDHCVTICGGFFLLIPGVFDLLAPHEEKLPPGIYHLKWDQLEWD